MYFVFVATGIPPARRKMPKSSKKAIPRIRRLGPMPDTSVWHYAGRRSGTRAVERRGLSAIHDLQRSLSVPADRHQGHAGGGAAGVVHAGGVWWRVLGAGTFRLPGPPASNGRSRIAGGLVGRVVF